MELFAAVKFKDFIRHFRKLDDAAIVADIQRSMDDLETLNSLGQSFGAEMVATMTARVNANREKNRANGRLGGRPRKQIEDGSLPSEGACLTPAACLRGAAGQVSTPVPVSASGDAAVGGLLTPWERPETGETLERADAGIRKDPDASATVRAQNLDGDAATREGAEAAASGFATSPSDIQRRPGKSAGSSRELSCDSLLGGSERGADGLQESTVRLSPGARKAAEPKLPHGSAGNVMMTATEMERLVSEFGDVGPLVEEMSDYLLLHPNKYRSHYAALRNWCRRRRQEGRNPDGTRMTQGDRLARYFAEREQEIIHGHHQDQ